FFFSSRRRHTRSKRDWSSDVCSSDLFGRNLDLEITFGQQVVVTPRNYAFNFRKMPEMKHHYAMVGIALDAGNYPLYFDAANEKGDRKSTRLNSSHVSISYAVFCLKKK